MATDITGLLTGLLTPTQRQRQLQQDNLATASLGATPAQTLFQGREAAGRLRSNLGSLFGLDQRTPEQRVMDEVKPLFEAGDTESLRQAASKLYDVDPAMATELLGRVSLEEEAQAVQQQQQSEQERLLGAQTVFLSNAFPEQASVLTPLLEAGVPLPNLVEMGRGSTPQPVNQAELTSLLMQQGVPAEEAARRAAVAWNAREETPSEPSPLRVPTEATRESVEGAVDDANLGAILDAPWWPDSAVAGLSKDDIVNEVSLVVANMRLTPQQAVQVANNFYTENPGASPGDFSTSVLGGVAPLLQNPTTPNGDLGTVTTVRE